MNSGIDLQGSFIQNLMDLGLPAGAAKAIWMPVPMVLMLIAATMGVLVTTSRAEISAAAQQRIGPDFMGPLVCWLRSGWSQTRLQRRCGSSQSRFFAVYSTDHCCDSGVSSYLIVPFGQNLVSNKEPEFFYGLHYLAFSRLVY